MELINNGNFLKDVLEVLKTEKDGYPNRDLNVKIMYQLFEKQTADTIILRDDFITNLFNYHTIRKRQ